MEIRIKLYYGSDHNPAVVSEEVRYLDGQPDVSDFVALADTISILEAIRRCVEQVNEEKNREI